MLSFTWPFTNLLAPCSFKCKEALSMHCSLSSHASCLIWGGCCHRSVTGTIYSSACQPPYKVLKKMALQHLVPLAPCWESSQTPLEATGRPRNYLNRRFTPESSVAVKSSQGERIFDIFVMSVCRSQSRTVGWGVSKPKAMHACLIISVTQLSSCRSQLPVAFSLTWFFKRYP